MRDNVFSPSFGNRPSKLVGRDDVLKTIIAGLNTPKGTRERAIIMLGQRGSGKTVLLWEVAEQAKKADYIVATPTITSDGMLDRLVETIQDAGESHVKDPHRKVAGASIGALGFSAGLQFTPEVQENKSAQYKLTQLARRLSQEGKGMLILIDELQANSNDVRQLVIAYQEMVGEGLNVALLMAGLPGAISATLNDKVLTFLNRATKIKLDPLLQIDVDAFYAKAFSELGITFPEDLRKRASEATMGSLYLLQLIGHGLVTYAGDSKMIDETVLKNALDSATLDFENDICGTSLASLSDTDSQFLYAMASLGTPAQIKDIANKMSKTSDYVQKYRIRLINAGIIRAPKRGKVEFAVPYLENYLQKRLGE